MAFNLSRVLQVENKSLVGVVLSITTIYMPGISCKKE